MKIQEKMLQKLANGSDVRGVAMDGVENEAVTLSPGAANVIAAGFVNFLVKCLGKNESELHIAVGHDSRLSAHILKQAVFEALVASGCNAIDCGLASTPAMFMSTIFEEIKADGAIMITASHLPYNRNGLKFFTQTGGAEPEDINTILNYAAAKEVTATDISSVHSFDLMARYSYHLREKIRSAFSGEQWPLQGMHIVVDAGNGAGGFFVSMVLDQLGANTTGSVFLSPDGCFPNHIPNPENPEAMAAIRRAVLENQADIGLIFDTDVDRMSAVLNNGKEINRNQLIALMAAILAPDYSGSTIVTDSVTSDELTTFLEKNLGLKHLRFKRGYKNVINKCIELNNAGVISPLAIETSGHGALSENYYLDDGAYLAVKLLTAAAQLRRKGCRLSELIKDMKEPVEAKEYRLRISGTDDFKTYGQNVLKELEQKAKMNHIEAAVPNYEGVRLVFPEGWVLLRLSLHDPQMPLNVESHEAGGVKLLTGKMQELLTGFECLDVRSLG
jgi:phosphomannomutase